MGTRRSGYRLIGLGLVGLLLVACAVPATGSAPAAAPPSGPAAALSLAPADQVMASGITVVGEGQARARPDQATLRLGVETTGQTAQAAMDQNSQAMAKVVQALKGAGVDEREIQTTGLSLTPVREQPRPVPGGQTPTEPRIIGYRATNNVVVVVGKIDRAGPVIDAAIAAGANVAGGLQFGLKDPSQLKAQALEAAVKAAQAEAETIARTLGLKISGVVAVSEEQRARVVGLEERAMLAAPAAAAPVPVEAGELTMTVRVRVTFKF